MTMSKVQHVELCEKCGDPATRYIWEGSVVREYRLDDTGQPDATSLDEEDYGGAGHYLCDCCCW